MTTGIDPNGDEQAAAEIFGVSDDYVVASAALDPMLATFWGIPGHDDEMTDYSPDGWAARLELQRQTLQTLAAVAPTNRRDRIATDVMRERVETERDMIDSGEYHRWLSVMNSHHEYVKEIFDFMPRQSAEEWENVRRRLALVPTSLDNLRESFQFAAARGQVAARRQVLACAEQCIVWTGPHGFFSDLATQCDALDLSTEAGCAANAYAEFAGWLRSDYASMASPHDPVGPDRYRLFSRYYNGTELDLEEAYAWGWDQLHGIEQRMNQLVGQIGPGLTRDECVARLNGDPRYMVGTADEFMKWGQDVVDRTIEEMNGSYFEIAEPLQRCQVMAVPDGGPDTPYYTPPNEEFTRPGQIWLPVIGKSAFPLWDVLTVVHHESVPGHHLQLAQMMHQAGSLTRFQRLGVVISGHGEGWALYAERLMHDLGYLDDPVFELGWLAGQALRSARVVLDIGIHCGMRVPHDERFHPGERWDAAMALPFLLERTTYPEQFLGSEVDRYLGMPGQAISYKLGERVWLEGRDRSRQRLGADFDLKHFHQAALNMGAMGLDQLLIELEGIGAPAQAYDSTR